MEDFITKIVEEEKEAEAEETPTEAEVTTVKPTSLQQKMVALSGQNVDEFMKEMETVQKKLESNRGEENRTKLTAHIEALAPPGTSDAVPAMAAQAASNPPLPPPHMFPNSGIRLPPGKKNKNSKIFFVSTNNLSGPPPGRPLMPPGPPPGLPPRLPIRMQQVAPRMIRLPGPPALGAQLLQPNVLSAAPQLINRSESAKQGATISAKPQIRNLSADVTRFVPSTLRVKREDKKPKQSQSALVRELKQKELTMHQNALAGQHTKDDAYKQFMQEMEQLL